MDMLRMLRAEEAAVAVPCVPSFSSSDSLSPSPGKGLGVEMETERKSLLEKPLEELTEEDIRQLTREDCRRYLKERGMRRPSWNKAQAIQQVLSLKGLFDPKEDEDASEYDESIRPSQQLQRHKSNICLRPCSSHIPPSQNIRSERLHEVNACPSLLQSSLGIQEQKDEQGGHISHRGIQTQHVLPPSQNTHNGTRKQPTARLTIFYAGMVNVYEDIPADKAQGIMLLAGSVNSWPSMAAAIKTAKGDGEAMTNHSSLPSPTLASDKEQPWIAPLQSEQPPSRKASVQRFLEKRKERSRSKGPYPAQKHAVAVLNLPLPDMTRQINLSEKSTNLLEKLTIANLPKFCDGGQGLTECSSTVASLSTKPTLTPQQNNLDEPAMPQNDALQRSQENMPSSPPEDKFMYQHKHPEDIRP